MNDVSDRSYLWAFYTSVGFLFASAVLRSLLEIQDRTAQFEAILLLFVWLGLFVSERAISRTWRPWTLVYLALQTVIVVALFSLPGDDDFFAILFAALSMQSLRWFGLRGAVCIAVFAPLLFWLFLFDFDVGEALALTLVYSAANIFLGAYALATRRAEEARNRTRELALELQTANAELTAYVAQADSLAVARERNRAARELHDSVTQTIFSMTLAGQSAVILLDREPAGADAQLDRLGQLAENALAEMRVLISELKPDSLADGDLVEAIRRDIDRRGRDGMSAELVWAAHPVVARLAEETTETVNLAVWASRAALIVDAVLTSRPFKPYNPVGLLISSIATVHVKLFMAFGPYENRELVSDGNLERSTEQMLVLEDERAIELDRVRAEGIAYDLDDWIVGMSAVGAPVFDASGEIRAAIGVVAPSERFGPAERQKHAEATLLAAQKLSEKLGYRAPMRTAT